MWVGPTDFRSVYTCCNGNFLWAIELDCHGLDWNVESPATSINESSDDTNGRLPTEHSKHKEMSRGKG